MPQLSVIIPAYNEAKTILQILEKINGVDIDKEIIVVENGSTDDTAKILRGLRYPNLKVIYLVTNRGKGGGCLTGISNAAGEFVIIQDADLEYDPNDYIMLMDEIRNSQADVVLGARFLKGRQGLFMHRLGNKFLTRILNIIFDSNINDFATCYKLARRSVWSDLNLRARGFDFEVEIICNALKKKKKIIEVPISYYPRTYEEGKKIRWWDGLWVLFYIFKYRFVD